MAKKKKPSDPETEEPISEEKTGVKFEVLSITAVEAVVKVYFIENGKVTTLFDTLHLGEGDTVFIVGRVEEDD